MRGPGAGVLEFWSSSARNFHAVAGRRARGFLKNSAEFLELRVKDHARFGMFLINLTEVGGKAVENKVDGMLL